MIFMLRREFGVSAGEAYTMPIWERELLIGEYNSEQRAIDKAQRQKG